MEWILEVPQATFTLLPIDCFQVEEQISGAAQTLKVIIRNTARPVLLQTLTCDKPRKRHVDPTTDEDHRQNIGYISFHHICQHGRICKSQIWRQVAVYHNKGKQDITSLMSAILIKNLHER